MTIKTKSPRDMTVASSVVKSSKSSRTGGGVYFQLEGMDHFEKLLNSIDIKLRKKALSIATRDSAKVVLEYAKRFAPVDSGKLRKSLVVRSMVKTTRENRKNVGHSVRAGAGWYKGHTYYAAFLEFGTRKMEAQPFLRPAVKAARPAARAIFRKQITAAIRAIARQGSLQGVARMSKKELARVVDD